MSDVRLDYLEFTFGAGSGSDDQVIESFMEAFPEFTFKADSWQFLDKGRFGYETVLTISNDFFVMWSRDYARMGVHVQIPAHGLFNVADLLGVQEDFDVKDSYDLLNNIYNRAPEKISFTRIDLAYDDYCKTLYPKDYERFWDEHRINSKWRTMRYISKEFGGTVYFGVRGKDNMLRIYDKEVESGGDIPAIRYEFEIRHKMADQVAHQLMKKVKNADVFSSILEQSFCVLQDFDFTECKDNQALRDKKKYMKDTGKFDPEFVKAFADLQSCVSRTDVEIYPSRSSSVGSRAKFYADISVSIASLYIAKGKDQFFKDVAADAERIKNSGGKDLAKCLEFISQDGLRIYNNLRYERGLGIRQ